MKTHRTNDNSICLTCLTVVDAASNMDGGDDAPTEGDISICAYCATVGKFNENMSLEPITMEELKEIEEADPMVYDEIAKVVYAIKAKNNLL